ncbi:putative E3 ubiquitin-protein ligase HUL4 KNAG_0I00410 [Huiozyma naganishii CBS 8797]|uniref:HECT-type E3 ubiquitin transferase n=1 Tax=Huiozyma naganishii (strain ATCC MYA-139 / BCRC 22969 / CBS 8797 / KCTC 17520 / NBRC 10181 / NCYC 3082 / Yp74L-3) TaxID=1071383 RepID=J7S246_HUIN7|nr:hypothetical protein KNAG_0I00410 [Kazachstania naganishii CBS 8797]CCK71832.1 hypothetical protein KNAG_0I00410 [Kazachstania naganishii CBS 8797]
MGFLFSRKNSRKKTASSEAVTKTKVPERAVSDPLANKPKDAVKQKSDILDLSGSSFISKCLCCGTNGQIPTGLKKFKCSVCYTTNSLVSGPKGTSANVSTKNKNVVCSLQYLQHIIQSCLKQESKSNNVDPMGRTISSFEPVSQYLTECFHDADILERSFYDLHILESINLKELHAFYDVIMKLPSRKPFYQMICACNDLLKKPKNRIESFRWIFIIWENPACRSCLTLRDDEKGFESPQIKAVAYELTKRCIGYLSHMDGNRDFRSHTLYLKNLPTGTFFNHIETLNLYLTYQLSKILYSRKARTHPTKPSNSKKKNRMSLIMPVVEYQEHLPDSPGVSPTSERSDDSKYFENANNPKNKDVPRIKPYQYQGNWHIRTACALMSIYHAANTVRGAKEYCCYPYNQLSIDKFYNTVLDFIDYKQDFDNWKGLKVKKYLNEIVPNLNVHVKKFSFCRNSFLLSLGVKISIMEFETRKIMEYQAEMAFLDSLDKGKVIAVYFKIKVRRNEIMNDSLRALRQHQGDFLKSLRVEFVNEPGIDAGGLRKEWFMLLTREMLSKQNGLFRYVEESRYCWFEFQPDKLSKQSLASQSFYFLFGVVVGLAIYNGVILDLKFPRALYRKMCSEKLTFADYFELFPQTGKNLKLMLNYSAEDFTDVFGLTFETTYKTRNRKTKKLTTITEELCENGSSLDVTLKNKSRYVDLWIDYYMNSSVDKQFDYFLEGFHQVFGGCNSIGLFNSEELERLLCGDIQENKYDFDMLRSVTKYVNGYADDSPVVQWFWDILFQWDPKMQSKFLQFVTGSDRIPATGITTLPFKISRLKGPTDSMLPIAHTCFNEVSLGNFTNRDVLGQKLFLAVTESQGFEFR